MESDKDIKINETEKKHPVSYIDPISIKCHSYCHDKQDKEECLLTCIRWYELKQYNDCMRANAGKTGNSQCMPPF